MIPTIGNIALIFAMLTAIIQIFLPARFYKTGGAFVFFLIALAFVCLLYSYVVSDFSVLNVYNNSNTMKPLLYKITGTWGNHEGSMLLLVMILAGYNLIVARWTSAKENSDVNITTYLVQQVIMIGFLSFIIFTSNPFVRIYPVPENGLGLNPLLQDVGLAMHPPMLYLGYIGFSVAFSFAIAALIHGRINDDWILRLRKIVLTSWGLLTIGIGLGSWWAYRELGWGGFWFWDPVENVSLMPWLAAAGLYHALLALEKRGVYILWAILVSILTFCLSLIGIFLVRSGVISSVHSFASDPSRGIFILCFIGFVGLCAFTLFYLRAGRLQNSMKDYDVSIVSKESLLAINNIFFLTLSATVLLGTIYPIMLEIFTGAKVSVGAPYFNTTFVPIALLMLLFAAFTPNFSWGGLRKISYGKNTVSFILALIISSFFVYKHGGVLAGIAIFIAVFLFVASLQIIIAVNNKKLVIQKLPARTIAMVFAHAGAAILVIGITVTSSLGVEQEKVLKEGDSIKFANYEATLVKGGFGVGKNYIYKQAQLRVFKNGNEITNLYPEIRVYPIEGSSTIEADLYYTLFSNIYAAIGEVDSNSYATRIYYKPMVNLIWLGCITMAIGGIMAAIAKRREKI